MTPIQQLYLGVGAVDSGTDIYPDDNFRILDYKGTGNANHEISNGINYKGKTQTGLSGGMVLIKNWETANKDWWAVDTVQGVGIQNRPNKIDAKETHSELIKSFNKDGITVGSNSQSNTSNDRIQAFCFRKRAKFFDVVTYTGNGNSSQSIAHNLGSVPGMIWVKKTNGTSSWGVYHRGLNNGSDPWDYRVRFPPVQESAQPYWGNTAPTSTHFTVGSDQETGENNGEYVAYLFAHNEAAFGPNENKTMSYCGYYTGNGSADGPYLNDPGWEPQLLILNRVTGSTSHFYVIDNQRGLTGFDGGNDPWMGLTSDGNSSAYDFGYFKNRGFKITQSNADINASGSRYIYYMVRAQDGITSPATPAAATDVFHSGMGDGTTDIIPQHKTNFKVSFGFSKNPTASENWNVFLRGQGNHTGGRYFRLNLTSASAGNSSYVPLNHEGFIESESSVENDLALAWKESSGFRRYQYKGTGSFQNHDHSLGATPEMMWVKSTSTAGKWTVYHKDMHQGYGSGLTHGKYFYMYLTEADARVAGDNQRWNGDAPNSMDFSVGGSDDTNKSGEAFMALLFRSVSGISKVDYYTGDGSNSLYVALGFAPKFLLIKRADAGGDWFSFHLTRGFSKSIILNSSAAESTTNYVTNNTAGFTLTDSNANVNANGGKYIYYAHA